MNPEQQSPNADISAAMQNAAGAVLVALSHVEQSAGPAVASTMAQAMVRLATIFIFERIGPTAARHLLVETYAALTDAIAAGNAGSGSIS
jgi:hypothetical protein